MLSLALKPRVVWVSSSRRLSIVLCWRAQCKLPNAVTSNRRCLQDVVKILIIWDAAWHSPGIKMDLELISKPDRARAELPRRPIELLGHELFPPHVSTSNVIVRNDTYSDKSWTIIALSPFTLREISQAERETCVNLLSRPEELIWQVLKPPDWAALR